MYQIVNGHPLYTVKVRALATAARPRREERDRIMIDLRERKNEKREESLKVPLASVNFYIPTVILG